MRKVLGALNLRRNLTFMPWATAQSGFLLHYFEDDVPYEFMYLTDDLDLYIGPSAIPFILKSLWY